MLAVLAREVREVELWKEGRGLVVVTAPWCAQGRRAMRCEGRCRRALDGVAAMGTVVMMMGRRAMMKLGSCLWLQARLRVASRSVACQRRWSFG